MRGRSQADDLRTQTHRAVVAVVRDVIERNVNRQWKPPSRQLYLAATAYTPALPRVYRQIIAVGRTNLAQAGTGLGHTLRVRR